VKIKVKELVKCFAQGEKELIVLNGINAEFDQKRNYAITGVSGTGKSTFLHLLAGLDIPTSGAVCFDDKDVSSLSAAQKELFLNKTVGLMFQSPYLISELSVLENVIIPGMIAGKSYFQCKNRALSLLDELGVKEKAFSAPQELSGGQQQRVALARALFNQPQFLLADEPTGNLDVKTGKAIVDLLLACKEKWGMGIIISSHDPYVAKSMDVVYRLESGRLTTAQPW